MHKKEIIKEFLSVFPYEVMHEEQRDNNNAEIFFCVIKKAHLNNKELKSFFHNLDEGFNIDNLSKQSKNYLSDIRDDYHLIHIDTIEKNKVNYEMNKKFILENANNILSLKHIGEAADVNLHITSEFNKYSQHFKKIGLGLGFIVKNSIEDGIKKSKEIIKEKKPQIEHKTGILKRNVMNKISNLRKTK